MGKWGYEPWANDSAANWFDSTFDLTGLAEHVEQTLNLPIDEHADEVRAAAYIVTLLSEHYMWPINSRTRCVRIAIARLHEIAADVADSQLAQSLQNEIVALESKLNDGQTKRVRPDLLS